MLDFISIVLARAILQLAASVIAPPLPYIVTRQSREVLEYIALKEARRLDHFEGTRHIIYWIVWSYTRIYPKLSPIAITKTLIFIFDVLSAAFWYFAVRLLPRAKLNKNNHVEGYNFATSPWFIAGLHLLNPFSVCHEIKVIHVVQIAYNEGSNADGVGYFWISFAVFAAVNLNVPRYINTIAYIIYQIAATGLVINGSFKMYAVIPALTMLAIHKRLKLSSEASITRNDLKQMARFIVPHVLVTASLLLLYHSNNGLTELKQTIVNDYTGRGTGINYSIYWYMHRVVPTVFKAGNTMKSHMMLFLVPLPLLVLLRLRPLECLITTLAIALIQHPQLSILGIWYTISLLAVHYPMLDKSIGFTKMMMVAIAAMLFSITAYVVWVERYIANPNYFFAPQIIVMLILCMVLEDYTSANLQLSNSGRNHEKHREHGRCRRSVQTRVQSSDGMLVSQYVMEPDTFRTALNLAVENNWGGEDSSQKRDQLVQLVTEYCISKKVLYNDEVEDILIDRMQTLFSVYIEDGSEIEIATLLVQLHRACSAGELQFAQEICNKLTKCDSTQCHAKDQVQEVSDSENEVEQQEQTKNSTKKSTKTELLDDGWTRVL
ncbi:Pre-rRNA-processing protein TSR2 -like protein [Babesia sp. Xinjiang]|uniref:Pre-rRNA-processing protein TSR2 -like protein n=1 Tax=Babesia sp. Xinjiang TaxID=462227 RepID=UPI000A23B82A|nr:Pre-rRNA-processing protein TSR2 -like protein [Babesia sp. Xinjiang]ORM41852.1 Pre-rRNA-processing protein TSR2 -like protein [Babesia sp. Xinjiang]